MKRLSGRERLFAGIFLVALAWGIWNYRHLFTSEEAPTPAGQAPIAAAAVPGVPVQHAARAETTVTAFEAPDWGVDAFYPAWRRPPTRVAETPAQSSS